MIDVLNEDRMFEMANIRGKRVKNPKRLNFSFYFSSKDGNSHSIRVKPVFNPEKLIISKCGVLELHGDWEYTPGSDDKSVSNKDIAKMKEFFRKYLVLFCMVWDEQLTDGELEDYLLGLISWEELLSGITFYTEYSKELSEISDVESLESFCREHKLVNMYGN